MFSPSLSHPLSVDGDGLFAPYIMKFGYCSWLLAEVPLPERFEFLHQQGCDSVSILQNVVDFDAAEKAEGAAVIREHDMMLCVHGNVQEYILPDGNAFNENSLRRLYEEVDWWNEATGGRLYDCFSDSLWRVGVDGRRVQAMDLVHDLFRRHAAHFAGTGIRYGIENTCGSRDPHDMSCYNCDERFQEAFDLFGGDPQAGFLLDVGHAYVASLAQGIDFEFYLDSIPFEICELHITDNHGKQDEHLRPGLGTLDFKALRNSMERRGFDGPVNLEVCKDVANGIYAYDLSNPGDRAYVRDTIALFRESFF